jgi:hypothetical protein
MDPEASKIPPWPRSRPSRAADFIFDIAPLDRAKYRTIVKRPAFKGYCLWRGASAAALRFDLVLLRNGFLLIGVADGEQPWITAVNNPPRLTPPPLSGSTTWSPIRVGTPRRSTPITSRGLTHPRPLGSAPRGVRSTRQRRRAARAAPMV